MLSLSAEDATAVSLVSAIQHGEVETLRQCLGNNPELATARVVDGKGVARTLLHIAADWPGHFPNGARVVAALISAGADVNAAVLHPDPDGPPETPLHWAASNNDVALVDALLDGGADIEAPGAIFTGGPPMSDAVIFAQWNAGRRLLERGASTTLWQAAALGALDRVRVFCSADPPPPAEQITNALWNACRGGHWAAAEYLVGLGAALNWIGHDDQTALDMAYESGNTALIQWLRDCGARRAAEVG